MFEIIDSCAEKPGYNNVAVIFYKEYVMLD
jgi:hypothetical protein